MKYYSGRTNLAATIFVPFACGNNCSFCNTNILYKDFTYTNEYLDNILHAIDICNHADVISEFVITGGEPFMNLSVLKQIIDRTEKKVFINTSIPNVDNLDECIEYINSEHKIAGINISRHIKTIHTITTADIDVIDKIKKYIRINCIVNDTMLNEDLIRYIYKYATKYRMINLRADYRTITTDNLKSRDAVSKFLLDNFKFEYSSNCLVCNSEFFSDEDYVVVCYHRGLEHSCVVTKDRTYVNDVIIDMYGNIYRDWDMIDDKSFTENLFLNKITK